MSLEATLVQEALTLKGLETPLRKTDVLRKDKRSELIAGYMTKVMELHYLRHITGDEFATFIFSENISFA